MARRARRRFVRLVEQLEALDVLDPVDLISTGCVLVEGRIITNASALVPLGAAVVIRRDPELRGTLKLRAALANSGVRAVAKTCLDLGAAAGGFTVTLLEAGARLVYAVDTGYGQLLGSLRQDARVINLERTNLIDLDERLVPDQIELVTADLSYVPLSEALPQLSGLSLATNADLLALVKPAFELRTGRPVTRSDEIDKAVEIASAAAEAAGWRVLNHIPSPALGRARAPEVFIHAVRQ